MVLIKNIEELPLERWKNGGGNTRTLASDADQVPPRWRLSVADIQASGPFSRFEGMDRVSVLLAGQDLRLRCGGEAYHYRAIGEFQAYAGETPTEALLDGGPCRFLNVMTVRAACAASVERNPRAVAAGPACALLLMPLRGSIQVQGHDAALDSGDYLLFNGAAPALTVTPLQADALWVLLRIAALGTAHS